MPAGPPPEILMIFQMQRVVGVELTLMSAVRLIRVLPHAFGRQRFHCCHYLTFSEGANHQSAVVQYFPLRVASLVKNLANQLAAENIRVNNLIPGRIDADRVKALDRNLAEKHGVPSEKVKPTQNLPYRCAATAPLRSLEKRALFFYLMQHHILQVQV